MHMVMVDVACTLHISKCVRGQLEADGWSCESLDLSEIHKLEHPRYMNRNVVVLIYTIFLVPPRYFRTLCRCRYVIYQLEQHDGGLSRHYRAMQRHVVRWLFNSSCMNLDFCPANMLMSARHLGGTWSMMPMPVRIFTNSQQSAPCGKNYDVLFVGAMNERRSGILRRLMARGYMLKIPTQYVNGPELMQLMNASRVILNIHYYERATLETARLNECLESSSRIVSELPHPEVCCDVSLYKCVDFVTYIENNDTSDLEGVIDRILALDVLYGTDHARLVESTVLGLYEAYREKSRSLFGKLTSPCRYVKK